MSGTCSLSAEPLPFLSSRCVVNAAAMRPSSALRAERTTEQTGMCRLTWRGRGWLADITDLFTGVLRAVCWRRQHACVSLLCHSTLYLRYIACCLRSAATGERRRFETRSGVPRATSGNVPPLNCGRLALPLLFHGAPSTGSLVAALRQRKCACGPVTGGPALPCSAHRLLLAALALGAYNRVLGRFGGSAYRPLPPPHHHLHNLPRLRTAFLFTALWLYNCGHRHCHRRQFICHITIYRRAKTVGRDHFARVSQRRTFSSSYLSYRRHGCVHWMAWFGSTTPWDGAATADAFLRHACICRVRYGGAYMVRAGGWPCALSSNAPLLSLLYRSPLSPLLFMPRVSRACLPSARYRA